MIVDRQTFTELVVHLKLASDAMLATARALGDLSETANEMSESRLWQKTIESMMAMNAQITIMEKILRAVMDANDEERPKAPEGPVQ